MRLCRSASLAVALCALSFFAASGAVAQDMDPGPARAHAAGFSYSLENHVIEARWSISHKSLDGVRITDKLHNVTVSLPVPFALQLKNGQVYNSTNLSEVAEPHFSRLRPHLNASRYSNHLAGEEFGLSLTDQGGDLQVNWTIILLDGSNYVRQLVAIKAIGKDVPVSRVSLIDTQLPGAHVDGSVKGSPIVAGDFFLGFEHPLSYSKVTANHAIAYIDRDLPLNVGQSITYSSMVGVARTGQLGRDFLRYIERERAHPYRTFLHYNSWYDIGYFNPYNEADALNRINAFGQELHVKRGVVLDSFLFDAGWDRHDSIWGFNSGFPDGFTAIRAAAAKYGAAPGVWLSPWGGYGVPKEQRIAFGKKAGYEIVNGGFALSGPKYYDRFQSVCLQVIEKYGVNQFKFDGTGNADSVFSGSRFDSDFDAAIHLIGELRKAKPDIYINLTTGTYPSPFWLLYADSIWRGGEDNSTAGVGTYRERWITYRDAETFEQVVRRGPLYPLNSLMLHGMIYAQRHPHLNTDPGNDFRNEIHSYFGTGTQLQEMYITPSLLTPTNWNDLAEAAKWSRANADVLKDTHWIGGDPAKLLVYGWASWAPRLGILVLRNPSDKMQTFSVDIQQAFQLPSGAPQVYVARSPWKSDAAEPSIEIHANVPHVFHLTPFEVLTLDLKPRLPQGPAALER